MHYAEVVRLAQKAWDLTKPASDPVWNECDATHRQMFLASAEAVINTGHAVNDFEHNVLKQARALEAKQKVIEEVASASPTSHSDEIQLEAAKRSGAIQPDKNPELPKAFAASTSVETVAAPQAEAPKPKRSHRAKPKDDEAKSSKKASKKSSKKGKK